MFDPVIVYAFSAMIGWEIGTHKVSWGSILLSFLVMGILSFAAAPPDYLWYWIFLTNLGGAVCGFVSRVEESAKK